ncbi:hypothetical protein NDU88_005293 [Pleurodeles waltl]|uniref:Uncharacterized protein n=1 Tax=Pleurodeles waltl TaxID=8319 RepID=A0AAV7VIM4_PLEWA|nr:hypothetical protein NDU88_005293 [Pleurodeles waltl]
MATLAHRCMVLHVAWFTGRLVIHHDVDLSSQDTVTIKTAKVLQLPILVFCLSVLVSTSLQVPPSVIRRLAVGGSASLGRPPSFTRGPGFPSCRSPGIRPPRVFYGWRGMGAFRAPPASPLSPRGPPSCGALHLGGHH